jgi:hypothetical protein
MADSRTEVPVGALMTVSTGIGADGRYQVFAQEGCKSEAVTPIGGLFIADCQSLPGMSGSLVYEKGADTKWHWTGLHARGNANNGMIAIGAKTIAEFFVQSFGEVPMAMGSIANDDRSPQSLQQAMANTSGKVTVQ